MDAPGCRRIGRRAAAEQRPPVPGIDLDIGGQAGVERQPFGHIDQLDLDRQPLHHLDQFPVAFSAGSSEKALPVPGEKLATRPLIVTSG